MNRVIDLVSDNSHGAIAVAVSVNMMSPDSSAAGV